MGIAPEVTTTETGKTIATKCLSGTAPVTAVSTSLPASFGRFKKANFLGESITQGINTTKIYTVKLQERLGITTIRNYGVSGTKLGNDTLSDTTSFVARYPAMNTYADLITVFGGTNDYGFAAVGLGTMADRVSTTFYGSLHTLYSGLKSMYPLATIASYNTSKKKQCR